MFVTEAEERQSQVLAVILEEYPGSVPECSILVSAWMFFHLTPGSVPCL